jgi:tetratricopeptide (TPR) repeat protein
LVLVLSYLLFGKKAAIGASILFAVHPVNAEPVLWISASTYLYRGMFTLVSVIFYVLYSKNLRLHYLAGSLLAYGGGLVFTRSPWVLVTPFIIGTLAYFFDNVLSPRKKLMTLSLFVFTSIIAAYIYFGPQTQKRLTYLETQMPETTAWLNRLPFSIYSTTKLLVVPWELSLFHEGQVISQFKYFLMFLNSLILFFVFFKLIKKLKSYAGLMALITVSLLPMLSPVQVAFFVAERYLYIASAFYCMLVALIYNHIKFQKKDLIFAGIIILFCVRVLVRTGDWKSSKTLWESNAKTAPLSARVFNNLGDAYSQEADLEKAEWAFKKAIDLKPNYSDALHNLGLTLIQEEKYTQAREAFESALAANPNYEGAQKAKEILSVLQSKTD